MNLFDKHLLNKCSEKTSTLKNRLSILLAMIHFNNLFTFSSNTRSILCFASGFISFTTKAEIMSTPLESCDAMSFCKIQHYLLVCFFCDFYCFSLLRYSLSLYGKWRHMDRIKMTLGGASPGEVRLGRGWGGLDDDVTINDGFKGKNGWRLIWKSQRKLYIAMDLSGKPLYSLMTFWDLHLSPPPPPMPQQFLIWKNYKISLEEKCVCVGEGGPYPRGLA